MQIEVNWWAIVLAALSTMVVGSVWYAKKVFGNLWIKLAKIDPKRLKEGSFAPIPIALVVSLITAFVLAQLTYVADYFYNIGFLQAALVTAFWVWLAFTAARMVTHDSFEGRPWKLTAINLAHEFVTIMVMGLVIGLMQV